MGCFGGSDFPRRGFRNPSRYSSLELYTTHMPNPDRRYSAAHDLCKTEDFVVVLRFLGQPSVQQALSAAGFAETLWRMTILDTGLSTAAVDERWGSPMHRDLLGWDLESALRRKSVMW